jgi:uncharacterized protein (DUF608 family)
MEPGLHVTETIPQARFLLRWAVADTVGGARGAGAPGAADRGATDRGARYIGTGAPPTWEGYDPPVDGFPEECRTYAVLFPECFEHYDDPDLPVEVLLHYWSPLVLGDEEAASLPVVYFTVHLRSRLERPIEVATALFWPNILGWRHARVPSLDRADRSWPGQTHSGNTARAVPGRPANEAVGAAAGPGVIQERRPSQRVERDMEGQVGLRVDGPADGSYAVEACMKADLNAIGLPPGEQRHTQAWAERHFIDNGALPESGATWDAHWHEPLSSALSGSCRIAPGAETRVDFTIAWDMPRVTFGSERTWYKRYTAEFGTSGRNAEKILDHAVGNRDGRQEAVERGRARILDALEAVEPAARAGGAKTGRKTGGGARTGGALLNELFLAVGNGTAWVAAEAGRPEGMDSPRLGDGEHFALLEGFDTGYYYYNTLDLWVYAFPAFALTWPAIADGIFADYLKSLETPDERPRVVYRLFEDRPVLTRHKAPHDLGSPMEDPWHELNGYTMRDDPNSWKDHNPALIASFYLHRQLRGRRIESARPRGGRRTEAAEWELLKAAGEHMLSMDETGDGLPRHREFGDSTWDALAFRGVSAYGAGLTLAAYRVLAEVAGDRAEHELQARYEDRLTRGRHTFEELLWSGDFYRTDSEGKYRDAVMSDALIGPYYASRAGLGEILPLDHVRAHLERAFDYNFERYDGGEHGPLLVSDGRSGRFTPDGGEELQINEVIVGSAWLLCGMLEWYGLDAYANAVADVLRRVIYERSGLQFRTPAAWDADGRFRAPMNMRPLAIWWLGANTIGNTTSNTTGGGST